MWTHVAAAVCLSAVAQPATVIVQVGNLRSHSGAVACRLYTDPAGFPEAATSAIGQLQPASGPSATCVFENLRPGRYAVAVFHDEDGDLQLAKNVLGAPAEGYGVSNNRTHLMRGPSFEEAAFMVGGGEALRLEVTLRY